MRCRLVLLLLSLWLVGCQAEEGVAQVLPTATATPTRSATATPLPTPSVTVPATHTATATPTRPATATPPPAPAPLGGVGNPARLLIPVIGVDASIIAVGKDAQGRMAVPDQVERVAWYRLGPRPGEQGNAVLSGHLDNYLQEPAVFWRLHELEVGDEVIVIDEADRRYTFEVVGKERYQYDGAPLERIFGFTIRQALNLITCEGIWDEQSENYDQRLVLYTRLKVSPP